MRVITDSGGMTAETKVLGVPCMTLRYNTEPQETRSIGTNELIGSNPAIIPKYMALMKTGNSKSGTVPARWDGLVGTRIVNAIEAICKRSVVAIW